MDGIATFAKWFGIIAYVRTRKIKTIQRGAGVVYRVGGRIGGTEVQRKAEATSRLQAPLGITRVNFMGSLVRIQSSLQGDKNGKYGI